jgi:hypothetical protein
MTIGRRARTRLRWIKWMSADPGITDLEGRLKEMEKWGISMQVLTVPFHGALVQDKSAAVDDSAPCTRFILKGSGCCLHGLFNSWSRQLEGSIVSLKSPT